MNRFILGSIVASATFVLVPQVSQAACDPANIVIDGAYQDWADCDALISDSTGDLTHLVYWDTDASAWTTTDPGYATYTFDDAAMMDVTKVKMLNGPSNVYFYMENQWPMMALLAPDGSTYYNIGDALAEFTQTELTTLYGFAPTAVPEFDHWMVWSFDTNQDDLYDYYFAANLTSSTFDDPEQQGPGLAVYQDTDGDGSFDETIDEKVADISTEDSSTSMDQGANPSALKFEIRQNIQALYDATGMSFGDTVKVRMETHSESGDTTTGKKYTFDLGAPSNLKVAQLKSTSAALSWKSLSSADKYQVKVYHGSTLVATKTVSKDSYQITGLDSATKYKFKVRGKLTNGFNGSWSDYKSFTTK